MLPNDSTLGSDNLQGLVGGALVLQAPIGAFLLGK